MSDIDEVDKAVSTWGAYGHGPARAEVRVESLGRPHRPIALPTGWQGVYCFRCGDIWMKTGKAGPDSGARWVSQHYKPEGRRRTHARPKSTHTSSPRDVLVHVVKPGHTQYSAAGDLNCASPA